MIRRCWLLPVGRHGRFRLRGLFTWSRPVSRDQASRSPLIRSADPSFRSIVGDHRGGRESSRPGWRTSRSASPVAGVVWEVYVKVKRPGQEGGPRSSGSTTARSAPSSRSARRTVSHRRIASATIALEAAPQIGRHPHRRGRRRGVDAPSLNDTEAAFRPGPRSSIQRQMGTASDYDKDRYAFQAAKATLTKAKADLGRLKITWEADKTGRLTGPPSCDGRQPAQKAPRSCSNAWSSAPSPTARSCR